jgi:hypothetical protein
MSVTDIAVDRQYDLLTTIRNAPLNPDAIRIASRLPKLLQDAVPCYWSWPAVRVAVADAKTYPLEAHVMRADLIAPVQWWYFDNPALPLVALRAEAEIAEAVLVVDGTRLHSSYANHLIAFFFVRVKLNDNKEPYRVPLPAWVAYVPFHAPWSSACTFDSILTSHPMDEHEIEQASAVMMFVVSAICWLRSTVPQRERTIVSRGTRRRLGLSTDHPSASTHVITLRASEHTAPATAHHEVEWSCRWSVRSHWRKQAVKDGHRLTLIPSYVKGPEGKPFRPPGDIRYKIDR